MEEERDGGEGESVEKEGGLRIDAVRSERHEILNGRGRTHGEVKKMERLIKTNTCVLCV